MQVVCRSWFFLRAQQQRKPMEGAVSAVARWGARRCGTGQGDGEGGIAAVGEEGGQSVGWTRRSYSVDDGLALDALFVRVRHGKRWPRGGSIRHAAEGAKGNR